MIPQRIVLSGFLSYKSEQEICFNDASIWMLSGTNGSGKSAIFDGLTYALFGHHRGGSQNASELINKDSSSMSVEFDFELEQHFYRIKRTLRRNARGAIAGTQQIFQRVNTITWEAVRDTNKKVDFDKWIHENIGLNYDTFTSSVLLLQGRAEKLLDARPSGRAEVLAGIVDLERYQRLHERANGRKLELKSRLDALSYQTSAIPEVSELEYAEAVLAIESAEDDRHLVRVKIETFTAWELQAHRWQDHQLQVMAARNQLDRVQRLLENSAQIIKKYDRYQELIRALPAIHIVLSQRSDLKRSEEKTQHFMHDREETQQRKLRLDHERDITKKKQVQLQRSLESDEQILARITVRLRELQGILERIKQIEVHEAEQRRLQQELERLPTNIEHLVQTLQIEDDRLNELNRILPILERLQIERSELVATRKSEQDILDTQARLKTEGEQAKNEHSKLITERDAAIATRRDCDSQLAIAQSTLTQSRAELQEFQTLFGEKNCYACGQPLTEEHFELEMQRRNTRLHDADIATQHTAQLATRAIEREKHLIQESDRLKIRIDALREQYRDCASQLKHLHGDMKRLSDSLSLRYAELPLQLRQRISSLQPMDWMTTSYPERDELITLRREVLRRDDLKVKLKEGRENLAKVGKIQARMDSILQSLALLREGLVSADIKALRQEQQSHAAEEVALQASIRTGKQALRTIADTAETLSRDIHTATQWLTDLQGKLNTEDALRKQYQSAIDRALQHLSEYWKAQIDRAGLAEYAIWKAEQEALEVEGITNEHRALESARGDLANQQGILSNLEAESVHFPDEVRRSPEEIRVLLQAAREGYEACDVRLRECQRRKSILEGYREQRVKLGDEYKKIDAEHNRYKILAELLGRDRLQRHLVRQAERQIVDYANAMLDRLSGGQLYLRLVGNEEGSSTDKALDLECTNRVTGGSPINVAFLSGSQKFRVAVSLALGIGRYSSRLHRPIESVIIDEGFGCLDRQGRQTMIQELQNLRGHLNCIMLVSHQEEFADAFADGYRFELQDGATKVSRFQR